MAVSIADAEHVMSGGCLAFATGVGQVTEDNANWYWDDANNRLGVKTNSPAYVLDVNGDGRFVGELNANDDIILTAAKTIGATNAGGMSFDGSNNASCSADLTANTMTMVNAISEFSTDGTLGGNSDSALPTEKAVKTYVDTAVGAASLYAFKTITGITNDVVADTVSDTLTLASADAKLTIVGTAATDTITFTVVESQINHDNLSGFVSGEHFLQTAITNVSTGLATGILTVTTGTGALGVTTDNTSNWDAAYTHISNNGSDHSYIDQSVVIGASPSFAGLTLTGLTQGSVIFVGASSVVSEDNANFFWDDSNNALCLGTTTYDSQATLARSNASAGISLSSYDNLAEYSFIKFRKSDTDTLNTAVETDDGDEIGKIIFHGVDSTPAFDYGAVITVVQRGASGTTVPTEMRFETYSNSAINSNQLLLEETGNVGVGTASISYKLDVAGTGRFTGELNANDDIILTAAKTIGATNAGGMSFDGSNNASFSADLTANTITMVNAISEFSTDGTLGGNSDSALPTEKAAKTYIDAAVADSSLYAFKTITGITNDVVADALSDTLTLASADAKLTIVGTAATDTITFTIVEGQINHDNLSGFVSGEHFLQTAITNVSTALATGLLTVTTGTGALGVTTDNTSNWDVAYTHVSNNGSDHSYIDQSVVIAASPTFVGLTLSGLTQGSALFAGAGGVITEDNANFFWDDSNNALCLGTVTYDSQATLARSNTSSGISLSTYDNLAEYSFIKLRKSDTDTLDTAVETDDGDEIGKIIFQGVDTSPAFDYGAVITVVQRGASGATVPTEMRLETYSSSAINSNQLLLEETGNVGIGTASISYKLDVDGTGRFTGELNANDDIILTAAKTIGATNAGGMSFDASNNATFSNELNANDDIILTTAKTIGATNAGGMSFDASNNASFSDDVTVGGGDLTLTGYGVLSQDYMFSADSGVLTIENSSASYSSIWKIRCALEDRTKNNLVQIHSYLSGSDAEYLEIGWSNSGYYKISSEILTSGTLQDLHIYTGSDTDQLVVDASGTVVIQSTLTFNTASITDTTGTISFGDENLTTTGTVTAGEVIDNGLTASRIVSTDGSKQLVSLSPSSAYTVTNVTTDRTYDANATTTDELADVLGTLIGDLQTAKILG